MKHKGTAEFLTDLDLCEKGEQQPCVLGSGSEILKPSDISGIYDNVFEKA